MCVGEIGPGSPLGRVEEQPQLLPTSGPVRELAPCAYYANFTGMLLMFIVKTNLTCI